MLWGGTDINPEIYNETPLKYTDTPDITRDDKELYEIDMAIQDKKPIIGVCRGAQLLCAYNSGSLYQHVELPKMSTVFLNCIDGNIRPAKVDHHQVMRPSGGVLLATQILSSPAKAFIANDTWVDLKRIPMVYWWPESRSLAIQPHPEWMNQRESFIMWVNSLCTNLLGVTKNVF